MHFDIYIPKEREPESRWIVGVILQQFLGLSIHIQITDKPIFEIKNEGKTLILPSILLGISKHLWLTKKSLPIQPLLKWDVSNSEFDFNLKNPEIPIIYGKPSYDKGEDNIFLNVDIFGSSFFMLSRYEEVVKNDRDQYGRFPATASLAYQENFLDRPIVNEYLEILWSCMKQLWPTLIRKQHEFRMQVTCDVDHPYQCGVKSPKRHLKQIMGDIIRRKNPLLAIKSSINYFASKSGNYNFDVYYTNLIWIMDVNEAAGNKVSFYFIAGHSDQDKDGCYSLDEPIIRKLMVEIHKRGHEIGLHPSYNTYKNKKKLCNEADNLRRVMSEEGVIQNSIGGRQHYLRWETSTTAKNWEEAGLDYDSTLGFADQVGFRCGTCYEYPLYDLRGRKVLKLIEKPLIVMEGVVIDKTEMNFGKTDKSIKHMILLKNKVREYNGSYELLWHNTRLISKWDRKAYKELIKC